MNILVEPPKEIFITKKEFDNFTYMDLACFWCNWKVAFCYNEDGSIEMYTGDEDICDRCMRNWRFREIAWYEMERAAMFVCTIPQDTELYWFIKNKLDHLIMK